MANRTLHIAIASGLVGLSCLVQAWVIGRAALPSLDAVRFVETAERIERDGIVRTVWSDGGQPLFPLATWLVHEGVEQTVGPFRSSWAVSAQIAAATALVLTVVPVYFLSLRLAGPVAAVAGSLVFCVLPEVARLGADGLSDSTHLLFFSLALWAMVEYFTDRGPTDPSPGRPAWLFVAGFSVGAAALARAEVLVLVTALCVTLVLFQLPPQRRQPWSRFALAATWLTLGFGLVFGPYLIAVQASTPRGVLARALGRFEAVQQAEPAAQPAPRGTTTGALAWRLADGQPMSFAHKELTISLRHRGYAAATRLLAEELADAYGYWIGLFALVGLWRMRHALGRPVDRFVQVFFLLYCLAVLHFVAAEGYLSARHLLPLVVPGVGCIGHGLLEAGTFLASRWRGAVRAAVTCRSQDRLVSLPQAAAWTAVILALWGCVLEASRPLHASKRAHRAAAEWLAGQTDTAGVVLDTRGWTELYSGRPTYRYDQAQAAFADPRLAYVVLERRELDYPSARSRTLTRLLELAARPVANFRESESSLPGERDVTVYRWNADRFSRWLAALELEPGKKDRVDARAHSRHHPQRGRSL